MRVRLALAALAFGLRAAATEPPPRKILFLEGGVEDGRWRAGWEASLVPGVLVVPFSLDGGSALGEILTTFAPEAVVSRRPPPPSVATALKARGLEAINPESPAVPRPTAAPKELRAYLELASAQLELADDRGARANVARALALSPKDPEALALLARIVREQNDQWLTIRFAGPRDEGNARLSVGDYAGAEDAFKRALRDDPADAAASYGLAQSLRERPKEALRHAEAAGAHRLAGEIRCDLGDAAGCEASLGRALEASADDLEALWSLARLKRGSVYARRAFEAAKRSPSWSRAAAYRLSARIWLEIKDEAMAAESLRRAIALEPEDLEALQTLERLRALPAKRADEPAPKDEEPLETIASVRRFADGIARMPAWQRADAWRRVTRAWLALGFPWRAAQTVREAENLDQRSIETATLISRLRSHLPGVEVDGPRSQQLAEIDRDIAKMRAEAARLRDRLLP